MDGLDSPLFLVDVPRVRRRLSKVLDVLSHRNDLSHRFGCEMGRGHGCDAQCVYVN